MTRRPPTVDEFLVRWHRWASSPVRTDDSLLRDFENLMLRLPDAMRSALVFHARNLACDATVWSSNRPMADLDASRAALAAIMLPASRWFGHRVVYLNARGNRVGESNPRAVLSDHEVDLLLQLRAEIDTDTGRPKYAYSWLAAKFDCSKSAVQDYCTGRRRAQIPAKVKKEIR